MLGLTRVKQKMHGPAPGSIQNGACPKGSGQVRSGQVSRPGTRLDQTRTKPEILRILRIFQHFLCNNSRSLLQLEGQSFTIYDINGINDITLCITLNIVMFMLDILFMSVGCGLVASCSYFIHRSNTALSTQRTKNTWTPSIGCILHLFPSFSQVAEQLLAQLRLAVQ